MKNKQETNPIIEVNQLRKSFNMGFIPKNVPILKGISFKVFKNETFGLLGPNGAGKTTTIKILMGLMRSDSGQVKIFDSAPSDVSIREKIGFLPEHPSVYVYLTGDEFLQLCGKFHDLPSSVLKWKIPELYELVGLPKSAGKKRIQTYSKGMMQRLGFAQAMIHDPELLLLDEPMSGLDPIGRHEVKALIQRLKKEGKTILFNSHILSDVEAICEKVGILVNGEMVQQGTLVELTKTQEKAYTLVVSGLDVTQLEQLCQPFTLTNTGSERPVVHLPDIQSAWKISDRIEKQGGRVLELKEKKLALEELFVKCVHEYQQRQER